jgi:hypothetical protein
MDLKKLATDVIVFLTPFFPYLVLGGEAAAKEAGKKLGEAAWTKAMSLWDKIRSLGRDNAKLSKTIELLAEDPGDEDTQFILAKSLAKQLESSPELATDLISIIKDDKAVQVILVEHGSKVKDVHQRLISETGEQKIIVRGSQTRNITQEQ